MQNIDRKQMIQQGFDTVASGYDHPSLSFFPETAKRLVQHLQLKPADHLLDVCTGTGCVALIATEKLPQGSVTGIDLSFCMLEQAKNKAAQMGLLNMSTMAGRSAGNAGATGKVEFIQMDLEDLSLQNLNRDKPFDAATSSFGLFFMEDMTAGLANIAGTVRNGGKIAITSFAGEAFSPMADIFITHYEATGRQMPPLSWKRLATEELIREQFNAVGISDVSIYHEPLGYRMKDPQMWWDVVWNAGWRALLNQMPEEEQEIFRKGHMKEIAAVIGDDGVWFNTEVLIAVGKKPDE